MSKRRSEPIQRSVPAVLALLVLTAAGSTEVGACGDKFLVGLRGGAGLRWAGTVQPARLLVYWQAEPGEDPDGSAEALFRSTLEEAGHSLTIVKDTSGLYEAVSSNRFEVLMMELETARSEQQRLEAVSPDSRILPVLHFGSRRERSAARKEFGLLVRTPTTLDDLLWTIERARQGGDS